MSKSVIWMGAGIGSVIGGYVPALWGADIFSPWSIILGTVGGLLGIAVVYKLYQAA